MENMEDFCVNHNYTQRELLLPSIPLPSPPSLLPTILLYIPPDLLLLLLLLYTLFFRIEKNHPGIKKIC